MEKYTIYMHITPSGKVYIGQTRLNPEQRWQSGRGYRGCKLFYSEIEKYGWNNIVHKILHTNLSWDQADILEKLYICFFKQKNISLNIADAGGVWPTKESMTIKRKFFDPYIKQVDISTEELIGRIYENNELKKQLAVLTNSLFVNDPSDIFK